MKKELSRHRTFITAIVNTAHGELPIAGINRAFQRNRVADFQVVLIGEHTTDQASGAIFQHRIHLLGWHDVFRVELKMRW